MNKTLLFSGVSAFALVLGLSAPTLADGTGAVALINAHMDGDQQVIANDDTVMFNYAEDNGSYRNNDVLNSYGGASGIAHVQQNNGSSNAIQAATAVQANITGDGLVITGAYVHSKTKFNYTENHDGVRNNDITDSFNGFAGVATVQQNNGDNNEIGAATAVHTNNGGNTEVGQFAVTDGFTGMQAGDGPWWALRDDNSDRNNTIDPSFEDASGIVTVQQNNGNGNAISAATAVAANVGNNLNGDSIDQAALTFGTVMFQGTKDVGLDRDNLITDSFTRFSGIATVQQNNGDANVLGASTAVAANIGPGLNNGNGQLGNDVNQLSGTLGLVKFVWAKDSDSVEFVDDDDDPATPDVAVYQGLRDNTIVNSFNDAEGVATVQQNNGSNNVMGAATAVQANIDTGPVGSLDGSDDVTQVSVTVGGTAMAAGAEWGFPSTPDPFGTGPVHRQNSITDSFNGYAGVATVQQNNGDNNVIGAATSVVANVGSGDKTDNAESFAGTLGVTKWNWSKEYSGANRDNTIDPSFVGATGVITVQQNNGNNNVMGVANTVVANVDNADDPAAVLGQNAAGGFAGVWGNTAEDHTNTDRVNTISGGSFNDAHGVMTVQQNNGDNNVMGASNAIAVDHNGGGGFGAAVSLAALSASVSGNTTIVNATSANPGYLNTIDSSFTGASGVMTVQQNNGSNNAIQSAISVTANF